MILMMIMMRMMMMMVMMTMTMMIRMMLVHHHVHNGTALSEGSIRKSNDFIDRRGSRPGNITAFILWDQEPPEVASI